MTWLKMKNGKLLDAQVEIHSVLPKHLISVTDFLHSGTVSGYVPLNVYERKFFYLRYGN